MTKQVKFLGGSMSGRFELVHAPEEVVTIDSEVYLRWHDHPEARQLPYGETEHHEAYVLEGLTRAQIAELTVGSQVALTTKAPPRPRS